MAGFKKAMRLLVWLKIFLTGPSGSGKSYSALKLAKGIINKSGGKIAYIGTEGSRDLYYASEFEYDLLQIEEPYTPEKYIEAIEEAIDAGYKCLIIDSLTHAWLEINKIHDRMPGNSFTNWGKVKPRYEALTEKILLSPIHIIVTARGKDQWVLEEQNGRQVPRKVGLGAQVDKDATYNYTVSFTLDQATHVASSDKDNTHLFEGKYDVITEKDGERLYEWANSSDIPAPVKEPKKYEEQPILPDDELKLIKTDIINLCKDLGGTKNERLMEVLKSFVPSGNPNAIKSIEKARECLAAVKGVPPLAS